jgi:mannitol-1-phosphate 5-dehydrogenase
MHNMSHALTAYFGYLRGYTYIWEANADADIRGFATKALAEASLALSKEYGVSIEELKAFSDNLIERFDNKLLGDTIERVGKDTKRKLSVNDRLVGAALLCEKLGISATYITAGIAAGLLFAPESDESAIEVAKDAKENGVFHALATYCGIGEDAPLAKAVKAYYEKLAAKKPFAELFA